MKVPEVRSVLLTFLLILFSSGLYAAELFTIQDLTYKGAVRFKDGIYGDSRLGFANGTFVIRSDGKTIYIVGHENDQAIGKYSIPEFSKATTIGELPMATNSEPFSRILDRATTGNPEGINRITGMAVIRDSLVINAARYYDGGSGNKDTTLILNDHSDIANSFVNGFYKLSPRVHASGWMTPIPHSMRDRFGGDYIFGYASNLPINGRNSMGPSAFSVKSDDLFASSPGDEIPAVTLLDFSIDNQLHEDHYNRSGENDLWTEISKAYVGFIVPGTQTYAVFGMSAGHESGIGYKITQDTGYLCGGACPKVASDRYNYYWFWNTEDLLDVKEGRKESYEIMPYDYGKIELPLESPDGTTAAKPIIGAYYDFYNQSLYFLLDRADSTQGKYESLPVLLNFDITVGNRPGAPTSIIVE